MVRAAAKNHPDVVVVVNPKRYEQVLSWLREGGPSPAERLMLAQEAFAHTAEYDAAISSYLRSLTVPQETDEIFPEQLQLNFRLQQHLRYGENPHQKPLFTEKKGGATVPRWRLPASYMERNSHSTTSTMPRPRLR